MRHVVKRQRHLHRHLKYAISRERVNSDAPTQTNARVRCKWRMCADEYARTLCMLMHRMYRRSQSILFR